MANLKAPTKILIKFKDFKIIDIDHLKTFSIRLCELTSFNMVNLKASTQKLSEFEDFNI